MTHSYPSLSLPSVARHTSSTRAPDPLSTPLQELKRRLAEEAAVAACTFAPDISPAASPGGKLAATRPRINMQASRGGGEGGSLHGL